jgi:hypothetical protein
MRLIVPGELFSDCAMLPFSLQKCLRSAIHCQYPQFYFVSVEFHWWRPASGLVILLCGHLIAGFYLTVLLFLPIHFAIRQSPFSIVQAIRLWPYPVPRLLVKLSAAVSSRRDIAVARHRVYLSPHLFRPLPS